ncbi:uncharacterized protein N7459_008702 [Penicillium hispanicum]|uniref:uncharacterized protein n=1 Tax=Penicillium hispanicum TaxID=1080232 RepID=UPI0025413051|nr:uncharacterized protein N7459_008702 [Penicillium hispanicum]KAJ5574275.1 hypothetical protein N7459_008702 [Penicillium hispanicum]
MDSMSSMTMTMAMAPSSTVAVMGVDSSTMPPMSSMPAMPGMQGMDMSCKISMLWNWNTIDACFLSSGWHIKSRGMFAGSCIGVIALVLCLELLRRVGREYDAFILRRARLRRTYLSDSASGLPATITKANSRNIPGPHATPKKQKGTSYCANTPSSDDLITPIPDTNSDGKAGEQNHAVTADINSSANVTSQRDSIDSASLESYRPSPVEQVIRALLHMLQFAVAYFIMLLAMYFNGYIIICIFIGAFFGSLIFSWEPVSMSKE